MVGNKAYKMSSALYGVGSLFGSDSLSCGSVQNVEWVWLKL